MRSVARRLGGAVDRRAQGEGGEDDLAPVIKCLPQAAVAQAKPIGLATAASDAVGSAATTGQPLAVGGETLDSAGAPSIQRRRRRGS
jgi:hypothetical protein